MQASQRRDKNNHAMYMLRLRTGCRNIFDDNVKQLKTTLALNLLSQVVQVVIYKTIDDNDKQRKTTFKLNLLSQVVQVVVQKI